MHEHVTKLLYQRYCSFGRGSLRGGWSIDPFGAVDDVPALLNSPLSGLRALSRIRQVSARAVPFKGGMR
jgi:hypothetical protein